MFDLLVYLVRNRNRVVSTDELIEGVWGGRIVSDPALTTPMPRVGRSTKRRGAARHSHHAPQGRAVYRRSKRRSSAGGARRGGARRHRAAGGTLVTPLAAHRGRLGLNPFENALFLWEAAQQHACTTYQALLQTPITIPAVGRLNRALAALQT